MRRQPTRGLVVVTPADPAAGAQFVYNISNDGVVRRLVWWTFDVQIGVVAGNRRVRLTVQDTLSRVYWETGAAAALVANDFLRVCAYVGGENQEYGAGVGLWAKNFALPSGSLPAAFVLQTNIVGLLAGDQIFNVALGLEVAHF